QGVNGRIFAQAWVPIAFAGIAVSFLFTEKLLSWSWRPQYIKEALDFGLPLIPHVAGAFLLLTADRFVVNSKLGLEQAGVYMVAIQLTMAMSILFDAFNKAYVPWLFESLKRNCDLEKRRIVKWTYLYFLILLLIAFIAFIFGPIAVDLIA